MADIVADRDDQSRPSLPDNSPLEAWSQGFMLGALLIMCGITLANMRRGVLLHKLILVEVQRNQPNPTQTPTQTPTP